MRRAIIVVRAAIAAGLSAARATRTPDRHAVIEARLQETRATCAVLFGAARRGMTDVRRELSALRTRVDGYEGRVDVRRVDFDTLHDRIERLQADAAHYTEHMQTSIALARKIDGRLDALLRWQDEHDAKHRPADTTSAPGSTEE